MSAEDRSRILSWLSQVGGGESVIPHADNHPCAKFIFDGIPMAKQTVDASHALRGSQQAAHRQQDPLDSGRLEQSNPDARRTTKGADSHQSRKEKNAYERIPRSRTKEDRYEYKGKSSQAKGEGATTRKKTQSKQRRRHTINEDFHASNVPTNRLTLHSSLNLGIFNKGKRSSPVKTRVLDPGFSETNFFNKLSLNDHDNQSVQQTSRLSMFNYDTRIEDPRQMNYEPRAEVLRPSIDSPRARLNGLYMGITHGDTASYDELEPGNSAIVGATPGPFSQLGNQPFEHEKQDILHEKTAVNNCMDDSRVVQALEKYLCSANTRAAEDSGRMYWSLEDLKHLMQQRVSRWLPEDKDSTSARISRPKQISLKRKHDSFENEIGASAELRKKRERVQEPAQKLDGNPTGRSTSSQVTLLGPRSFFHQPISVPATEGFLEHKHMDHAPEGTYFQPQRPCRDIKPSMTHNNDTSLISEAFDAAYEAIMRSETDAPYRLPDFPPIGDTIIGRHEDSIAAPILQTPPWMWESQGEEELNPFQFRRQLPSLHRRGPGSIPDMKRARQIIGQPLYLGDSGASQWPEFSIEPELALEPGPTFGRGKLEAEQHDFDIGPLKDFWLSNKLY